MQLYRFSPIKNEKRLMEAIRYIVRKNTVLCRKITGKTFPISYVTIFPHFPYEYEKLKKICSKLGIQTGENNGPKFKLAKQIKIGRNVITHLRIRQPDPYHMQVGCCDFDVEYIKFKRNISKSGNLRVIKRPDIEMIEFFHPNFDVLAYTVNKSRSEITF